MIQEVAIKLKKAKVHIAPSPDDDVHIVSGVPLNQERTGNQITIEYDQPRSIDVSLALPASVRSLDFNLGWGPATIVSMNLTDADINMGLGNLVVTACQGKFDVNVGKGNVTMQQLDGEIEINAGLGAVFLQQVTANGGINDGLGDITLENCRGSLDVNAGKGDIRGSGTSGHMEVNAGMGSILFTDSHHLSLEAHGGFGQIKLMGGILDNVQCESGIGSVTVEARVDQLNVDIKNRGDIHVNIPTTQGARIEASTDQGRVVSQMELVEVNNPGPARGHRLVGSTGDGSTHIALHTRRGSITLGHFAEPDGLKVEEDPSEAATLDPRLQILEQLQQGHLTIDEADALLLQLDENA
ncbi:MAG: DUF4097 domain-containing protein [Firmicutes bacterium]|nr:DUF4097 domain-containing protein [Bacillota bacterium]